MGNQNSTPQNHSPKGFAGETVAVDYLRRHGYTIIERNWIKQYAEIDIVAKEDNYLVIVEVKTRFNDEYGRPEEAMTPHKIRTLIRAADLYKMYHPDTPDQMRIDFVGIVYRDNMVSEINLIKNITG